MSKYEGNPELLTDLKGVPKKIGEIALSGASQNLKLSDYYILGSHSQIQDLHMVQKEIATEK